MTRKKLALIIIIALIWFHSFLPPNLSNEESGLFHALLVFLIGPGATKFFVRKLAHFVEYTILGALTTTATATTIATTITHPDGARGESGGSAATPKGYMEILAVLHTGFIVAFLDETIQLFSGRNAMIPDVWLDLLGILCGFILIKIFSDVAPIFERHVNDVRA